MTSRNCAGYNSIVVHLYWFVKSSNNPDMSTCTLEAAPSRPHTHTHRQIADGQAVSLPFPRGGRIECVSGAIWVTQEDCGSDVVLTAGQSFSALGRGKVVVQGLSDAAVAVWPW